VIKFLSRLFEADRIEEEASKIIYIFLLLYCNLINFKHYSEAVKADEGIDETKVSLGAIVESVTELLEFEF